MSWLQTLLCLLFGHRDVRLVSADHVRGEAMFRCQSCEEWWVEGP